MKSVKTWALCIPNGPTEYGRESTAARPQLEVDKEVAAHGVTIVELTPAGLDLRN